MTNDRARQYILTVSAAVTTASAREEAHGDEGMEYGRNPKDFTRDSNPGNHKGER